MSERNSKNQRPGMSMGPMGRGPMGRGGFEKPKDFKGTFNKLLKYLKPYSLKLILVIVLAIGSTIFAILGPKILGKATTAIFTGLISKVSGGAGIDFDYILNIVITLITLYSISAVFSYIQGFVVTGIAQKVSYNLRKIYLTKLISFRLSILIQ